MLLLVYAPARRNGRTRGGKYYIVRIRVVFIIDSLNDSFFIVETTHCGPG